ncbi:hypothetical protein Dsin_027930 [Dipteronia sinensis]|uniref:Uncharacterized protein n=1 Tax=Dipteronia sinensis TaxID=43782 RepID=A0AAD9ZQ55_9ROSI|nr:hypothetical protein Dsin_027930 [Dipteronia sinensis]
MSFFSVGHCYSSSPPRHRHTKFPISGYQHRRYGTPGTPLSHWKFLDEAHKSDGGGAGVALSARKLAAGLWQLHLLGGGGGGGGGRVKFGSCDWFRFQTGSGTEHVNFVLPLHRSSRKYGVKSRDLWQSHLLNCNPNYKIPRKHESSLPYPNPKSVMEGATKRDRRCSKKSTEPYFFYTQMKLLEGQVTTVSVVSALQAELMQAQLQILQLEDERQYSKMKFVHLMRKLGEERKSRRSREHSKISAVIDGFKDELSKERKIRKKIEFLNSKLVKKLADGESATKKLMEDYEKEKRGREMMEEVCNELAKKIGEDKVELDALNREAMKIHKEVEEERRMLQLAEVWREERVHMKLVDAKLALEHKYRQLIKLVTDLESLLRSQTVPLDIAELREAELIIRAVKSVNIQDIKEFEYVHPKSSGIFSIFKDLEQDEASERESDVGNASNYQIVPHEVSRCSVKGSDHPGRFFGSRSVIECNENGGENSPYIEINEVCSTSKGQVKRKAFPSNPKLHEITSGDHSNRWLSSGTTSSVGTSSPIRQRDHMENPHITRGMKGFIEWPQGGGNRKNGLKSKLLKGQKSKFRDMS